MKQLIKYSSHLKFNGLSSIPQNTIEESIQSECSSAMNNSNTFWDNFGPNIRRSNVLKAQIEKECRAGKNVS
jgi:hypothetical protein